ncbi:DUF4383 domain-containing protein [Longispora fulva]
MRSHAGMGAMSHNPVQVAAMGVGAVFALVGVLGFVPGITTHLGSITFAGHESGAMLLGAFQVSVLHNIVHLLFGIAGLAMARTWSGARMFLVAGGAIYLALWLYGLIVGHGSTANFVPVNTADNWLHLGLGVAMLALGTVLGGAGRTGADNRT